MTTERSQNGPGQGWSWARVCALLMLCVSAESTLTAQVFAPLHSFAGSDGAYPCAAGWRRVQLCDLWVSEDRQTQSFALRQPPPFILGRLIQTWL